MKANLLNRKVHYWLSAVAAVPVLVIIGAGLLLQWKKQLPWVQPPEHRGSPAAPALTLPQILEISRRVPEAQIGDWPDVSRVDFRPAKNLVKVTARNRWEIQLDASTGGVLQVAYRRSDLIEEIHEGSFFHEHAKLWLFFPVAVILLLLTLTGLWMFAQPFLRRRPPAR
ncbi:MAG: PepSY domain-containing protein [Opitutae bacterium]|nr:PepSY domain-containing protein [Opitutae bacterium]